MCIIRMTKISHIVPIWIDHIVPLSYAASNLLIEMTCYIHVKF
jgi:hypothetical protein